MTRRLTAVFVALASLLFCDVLSVAADSAFTSVKRDIARDMLRTAVQTVEKHYYDAKFHGMDLNSRLAEGEHKLDQARSLSEAFGIIAWTLEPLNDSHTYFIPPARPYDVDPGYQVRFVGDRCLITAIRPGSDAAAQGIKPGDELVGFEGFRPARDTLWKMNYAFSVLAPRSAFRLALLAPGAQRPREVLVKAAVRALPHLLEFKNDYWDLVRREEREIEMSRSRSYEAGDILIWKLPQFLISDDDMDGMLRHLRRHKALVLDLRGNPGGSEQLLVSLLGHFFDHEVKVAARVARKDEHPVVAKPKSELFTGKLVVLIDSGSASAAELFARTVQLEKRGIVVGDRSSGSVMEAKMYPFQNGGEIASFWAMEVADADLIMSDGRSLEHVGVTPDVAVLPTSKTSPRIVIRRWRVPSNLPAVRCRPKRPANCSPCSGTKWTSDD